jgi:hypothetical protein
MLLQYDADPDMRTHPNEPGQLVSIRDIASRNPDPRVRNLLSRARPEPTRHNKASLHVAPSKLDLSRYENDTLAEVSVPSSNHYATLWTLLGESGAAQAVFADEGDTEDNAPEASAWETRLRFDTQDIMAEPEATVEAYRYSRFLSISASNSNVRQVDQVFWADIPATTTHHTPATVTQNTIRKEMTSEELVNAQSLLKLEQTLPISGNAGKDFWARFSTNEIPCAKAEVQQLPTCEEVTGNKAPVTNE